jgi:hypothetical protein
MCEIMDGMNNLVIEFINSQPKSIREKYLAYFKLCMNETVEGYDDVYSKNFNYEDLRKFTSGITNMIFDQIKKERMIFK